MGFSIKIGSGMELPGEIHRPEGKIEKVMLLIHGLGDHYARYSDWSGRFAKKGIAVIGVDLPGHGISPGRRGHIRSYHVYNDVIDTLAQYAEKELGNVPIGLYGHSLGGNIALNYLLTNGYGFNFAVVTSPWIKLSNEPSKTTLMLAKVANLIAPGTLQPNGLVLEHISRANDVNEKYSNDPLVHDRISVRLACEAMDSANRILDTGSIIDIPVLVVHGTEDLITSPEGSKLFAKGNNNVTLKLWEKGYHELQNEVFNGEVFEYIHSWLLKL